MADIEYFYSAHSLFAYLGSARLTVIAQAAGRRIAHEYGPGQGVAHERPTPVDIFGG